MALCLGIDTSNYTTSAALYDSVADRVISEKKLLPVAAGSAGLRQADALFHHTRQLPEIMARLFATAKGMGYSHRPALVCASNRPRDIEGSYMPAFLAGECVAASIAAAFDIPKLNCSHQQGHIVSALHSANAMGLLKAEEKFYAFHVSGGTTECLLVTPGEPLFTTEIVAQTLDLNAGQLVDRAGLLLNMQFPCGPELDCLSREWAEPVPVHPVFHGADCHFSGAQNQCEALMKNGVPPAHVARFVIEYVLAAIDGMTERVMREYGPHPVLYAGGVMSNNLIRECLSRKYGGRFATPEFSSDNASGPAILGALITKRPAP